MKILVSNDDGVNAPGLGVLADALSTLADIRVVAPDRDHSGASNSLTLSRPLSVREVSQGVFSVDGTPTDCVHLGLSQRFGHGAERVVSGINTHANLGDDVLYSGTVAAAMEGRMLGLPAIAVSLANRGNWMYETAARVVCEILKHPGALKLPPRTILNINVPDIPYDALKGWQVTRLGHRRYSGEPLSVRDPRGKERFWVASAGDVDDAGEGTDFFAIAHDRVSLTPLHVDMTHYEAFDELQRWLQR